MKLPPPLDVPTLDRKRYDEVGLCIYCGAGKNLSDEHIVPFGLGGNLVLPKSSCGACAKITSRFERTVLRGPFRPIRVFRGIQSRRKHRDAPTSLPLRIRRDGGNWETIFLPHNEYPILLNFFVLDVPGYDNPKYVEGVRLLGHLTYSFGPRPEEAMYRLGVKQIKLPSQQYNPGDFARMTAKVAYSMAVALGQIDPARGRPQVVRSILGEVDDIGRWVGMISQQRHWYSNVLHYVAITRDVDRGVLRGRVQYLTDVGSPSYEVILGNLNDDFVRSTT